MRQKAGKALAGYKTSLTKGLQTCAAGFLLTIAWIVSLAAAFAGLEPLMLVSLMLVFAPLAALHLFGTENIKALFRQTDPLFAIFLAFAAYVLLSSIWSAYPQIALEKGFFIILIILGVGVTSLLLDKMSALQLHRCARGILIGLLVGMAFSVFEYATDYLIINSVAKQFPGLVKTLPWSKQVPAYHLNANVTAITLFLWPTLLAALAWSGKRAKKLFVMALLGANLFILYRTESATAQFALIFAILTYILARFAPRHIDLIARSLWTIAVVGVVPIIMLVHFAGLQNITSLPYSFRDRIHIWNYTAELVPKNPVLGIGIRSSRSYKKIPRQKIPLSQEGNLVDHQGWHTHNIFLQTWYELGALGAAFLLTMGLFVLKAIGSVEQKKRPFAYACFASFSVVAAFGYGMWQSWLLAVYGWTVIFLLIALRYRGSVSQDQTSNPGQ